MIVISISFDCERFEKMRIEYFIAFIFSLE